VTRRLRTGGSGRRERGEERRERSEERREERGERVVSKALTSRWQRLLHNERERASEREK
jgi:hypothetical protein